MTGHYSLSREDIGLKDYERENIRREHYRITDAYLDEDDPSSRYPLPEPVCARCHHSWGRLGCPTIRALLLLSLEEAAYRDVRTLADRVTEALSLVAIKGDIWAAENRDVLYMKLQVAGEVVRTGKIDVLLHSLSRIAREFRPYFEKRGAA